MQLVKHLNADEFGILSQVPSKKVPSWWRKGMAVIGGEDVGLPAAHAACTGAAEQEEEMQLAGEPELEECPPLEQVAPVEEPECEPEQPPVKKQKRQKIQVAAAAKAWFVRFADKQWAGHKWSMRDSLRAASLWAPEIPAQALSAAQGSQEPLTSGDCGTHCHHGPHNEQNRDKFHLQNLPGHES